MKETLLVLIASIQNLKKEAEEYQEMLINKRQGETATSAKELNEQRAKSVKYDYRIFSKIERKRKQRKYLTRSRLKMSGFNKKPARLDKL